MKNGIFKKLNDDLNWSTRIYILLVASTIILALIFDAWSGNWIMTIMGALLIILLVEVLAIYFKKYPNVWKFIRLIILLLLATLLLIGASACEQTRTVTTSSADRQDSIFLQTIKKTSLEDSLAFTITVAEDIRIKDYFQFIDQQVSMYDSLVNYELDEHILVRANPWLIDTLISTDYYKRMERGEFVYDQKELIILRKGDRLIVPAKKIAERIIQQFDQTVIDINIPEYALRILEDGKERYRFQVRVGQNRERYLETAGRIENLRTRIGEGEIFKISKNPTYINPVDGHRYETTLRDDGKRTKLPQIPFLHPEIAGHRWGQLIHPTTNPNSLGKAYSNGCIGTTEGDAWRIYYHAPIGTKVEIRYDLIIVDDDMDTLFLKDIYRISKKRIL